jgi:hypothetical protein
MKKNEKNGIKYSRGRKLRAAIAILMLLSFFTFFNAHADEIGPGTCGKPIMVQGNFQHYNTSGSSVANATDADMYLEEIYGNFSAVVEDLPEGSYTIEIYMAEQYHASASKRVFNIYYGTTLIKENLDLFSEVGKNVEYKFTHEIAYSPSDNDNQLSIRFETITDNAKFNAIRILDSNKEQVACVMASELSLYVELGTGNPFIRDIFTADPSAHVFEDKMYVYPSHDKDNANGFDMRDYHVFSSSNLSTWEDHGVVLDVDDVPWAKEYMWAPDCAYKDSTYYFYFPARNLVGDFQIGVATSKSPSGPFTPEAEPITGSFSVDPAVFIDDDGQAYMYFGGDGNGGQTTPWVAKLDTTMKQFSEAPQALTGISYWFEACWMNKINGIYYLSYSTGTKHPSYKASSAIAYATSTNPMGPFTYKGIVNGYVTGWTNHSSIVEYKGQTYFFYHNADLSGGDMRRRSLAAEYLHFNNDGSIRQVIQTGQGIGSYDGLARIEAENYSETGGVLKKECSEGGFQVSMNPGDSLVFNNVDFGDNETTVLNVRVTSINTDGIIDIHAKTGELLGSVQLLSTGSFGDWKTFTNQIQSLHGKKDIYLKYVATDSEPILLNWLDFTDLATSGINLNKNRSELHFYPNPADDVVNLNLPNMTQNVNIRMFDSVGRLIQVDQPVNGSLNIAHLYSGIYYLSIYDISNVIYYQGKLVIK